MGKRRRGGVAVALERVDAQIDRRAAGKRRAFLGAVVAEHRGEIGIEPFRIVAPHWAGASSRRAARAAPSASLSAASGGAGAWPEPSASRAMASWPSPRSSLRAPNRIARGVAAPIRNAAELLRRSASNTRPPMAARSPEPAKRWASPQSFRASAAGRRRASMSASTSIAAERRAPGVNAGYARLG